ncbi:MAG: hypothetical protein ACOYB3_07270 [Azonexus sp.]
MKKEFSTEFGGHFGGVNMTRPGGDRYKDKWAIIAVIRGALEEALLDAEIRRYFKLQDGEQVTPAKRRKMAKHKAGLVYNGLISALKIGASEPFEKLETWSDGSQHVKKGGVNFGGILKLGMASPISMHLTARNESGEILAEPTRYRRETIANGIYAVGVPGGFSPWWFYGAQGGYVGPIENAVVAAGRVLLNGVWYEMDVGPFGHKDIDGVTRCWVYVDLAGRERRVDWNSGEMPAAGSDRLKTQILDAFWADLNGLSWADLAIVGNEYP